MATSLFPDPLQMWRDALTRFENDANAMATGGMKSAEVMRSLQRTSALATSMQQGFEKMVEAYLRRAHLPSRKDLQELAEALQRIEEKLDRLLPPEAAPRPARTRRPAAAAQVKADAAPAAPPAKPKPAAKSPARTRRAGRK